MKVLVLIEEPTLASALREKIEALGDQVVVARDASEARGRLLEASHCLIAGDGARPGLDGPSFCRRIRSLPDPPYIYTILLASHRARGGDPAALRAVADDVLTRPVDFQELAARLAVARRFVTAYERVERLNGQLSTTAATDELTGLWNVRRLREAMAAAASLAARTGQPLSVVMIDVDHFKAYNDAFGHPAGDEVLRQVGALLLREVRVHDVAARYGGKEFTVLLPATAGGPARSLAERLGSAIAGHDWPLRPVTASLGVATTGDGPIIADALLADADGAMYQAKRAGRNRLVYHGEMPVPGGPCAARPSAGLDASPCGEPAAAGSATILHIEDDPAHRRIIASILGQAGVDVIGAATASEGLKQAQEAPDLIILDIRLPDLDGLEVCRRLKADPATVAIPVLCLSVDLEGSDERARGLSWGADATLPKSATAGELLAVIYSLLRARRSLLQVQAVCRALERSLLARDRDLEDVCDEMVESWACALELRDHETQGHSLRVAELTVRMARQLGFADPDVARMWRGAMLHDIGKVIVPDAVLKKAGPLDEAEWRVMRRHPETVHEILEPISTLRPSLVIPYCHHERWDGSGYPRGLKGEEIPLEARLFAVADVWDALRQDRPYRAGWPKERVLEHIRGLAGTHLDPGAVEGFLALSAD